MSGGWYFLDILWNRRVGLAYLGIVLPFGVERPGRVSIVYFMVE